MGRPSRFAKLISQILTTRALHRARGLPGPRGIARAAARCTRDHCACRWRFVQQLQYPLVSCPRIDRLLARPRLVFQPFKAMVGIAMPPKADNPRLDPNFLGDRPGAASGRRQQNDPCSLQIALQCHR
jgi:hypothetical protein